MMIVTVALNDFNSRSRTGSDCAVLLCFDGLANISIHAPAQGATKFAIFFTLRT